MNKLIKLDKAVYHTNDLAILWGTANRNTLYTTIHRYIKKGILLSVFKGLYTTLPLREVDPIELGRAIVHTYIYMTTESVLAKEGAIAHMTYPYTFASPVSKKISIGGKEFVYRKLKDAFLYNPTGIINKDNAATATLDRAVADMLYFNPRYHFDVTDAIDWKAVKQIQKEVGYI